MTQASSLSVHHGDIHLTSIISASAAPDTQTTVAGLSLINPSSVPLVYCPPWCHTLFLSLSVYIHHANTQKERKEEKKEREEICTSGQGFDEKVQPQRKPSDRQDGDRGAATRHHTLEFSVSGALRAWEERDTPTLHDQCTIRRLQRGSHRLQDESVMFCCLFDIQCSWHLAVRMAKSHPLILRITLLFASRKRMLSTCNG